MTGAAPRIPLRWSAADARRFLAAYHLTRGSLEEVLARLGSVQYDPLKPAGRNHDLVLQARVDGYRVDDWQEAAYRERRVYDAWDKQACLVPPGDWRYREIFRSYFRKAWHERIFGPYAREVEHTLAQLAAHGPRSSLDFSEETRVEEWAGSWYGPRLIKQILRALWDSGMVVTHHRVNGRHVYALPEAVLPAEHLSAPPADRAESLRFLTLRRHQSTGLLRPNATAPIWNVFNGKSERQAVLERLVAEGELLPVEIEGEPYHLRTSDLHWLDRQAEARMTFIAPLDSFIWDRVAINRLYGFDYVWEVYKPEAERTWGYYVLPVHYRDRFVARMEPRVEGGVLRIERWWWEPQIEPDAEMLEAFARAAQRFAAYVGAQEIRLGRRMARATRARLAGVLREATA